MQNDKNISPRKSKRSNAELLAIAESIVTTDQEAEKEEVVPKKKSLEEVTTEEPVVQRKSDATNLMPPPPVPAAAAPVEEAHVGRPKRAAKLKSEKSLKEPKLNMKMRRPTDEDIKVKLEHEQRASQMHEKSIQNATPVVEASNKTSIGSTKSNDSIVILPGKKATVVEISSNSDDDEVVQPTADPVSKKSPTGSAANEEGMYSYILDADIAMFLMYQVRKRL